MKNKNLTLQKPGDEAAKPAPAAAEAAKPAAEAEAAKPAPAADGIPQNDPNYRDEDGFGVGVRIILQGINSRPEYNGTKGTVAAWDKKNERWKVKLDLDGDTKAMKNKNLLHADKEGSANAAPPAMSKEEAEKVLKEGDHQAVPLVLGAGVLDMEDEILSDTEDVRVPNKKSVASMEITSEDDALVLAEKRDEFGDSGDVDNESDAISVILPDMDLSFLRDPTPTLKEARHGGNDPELIDADDDEDEIIYAGQSSTSTEVY